MQSFNLKGVELITILSDSMEMMLRDRHRVPYWFSRAIAL